MFYHTTIFKEELLDSTKRTVDHPHLYARKQPWHWGLLTKNGKDFTTVVLLCCPFRNGIFSLLRLVFRHVSKVFLLDPYSFNLNNYNFKVLI